MGDASPGRIDATYLSVQAQRYAAQLDAVARGTTLQGNDQRTFWRVLQQALIFNGYLCPVSGEPDDTTMSALELFQKNNELAERGEPGLETLQALGFNFSADTVAASNASRRRRVHALGASGVPQGPKLAPPVPNSKRGKASGSQALAYFSRNLGGAGWFETKPAGKHSSDLVLHYPNGETVAVPITWIRGIAPTQAWLTAIGNTFMRLPPAHVQEIAKISIDNGPTVNGRVEPVIRNGKALEKRLIRLNEMLFKGKNEWVGGSHGQWYMYRSSHDSGTLHQLGPDHDAYSPVLVHEAGHVMGHNIRPAIGAALRGNDQPRGKGAACATGRCNNDACEGGDTENWAEQYRLFFQGPYEREFLRTVDNSAYAALLGAEQRSGLPPPWERGLPMPTRVVALGAGMGSAEAAEAATLALSQPR